MMSCVNKNNIASSFKYALFLTSSCSVTCCQGLPAKSLIKMMKISILAFS